eukprot:CAMPEP_0181244010 /NCGR_PEP_ID=MMETSP1096-20121128/42609_1 /TAXON_ID=156174 ORGANISM="Chrysochromulina ericina, Strain CCMP281" /NCGR_SAMPLE_ID=MMETSP1096 /ASSEMBLY_ACC=CAM_ASM_000453 /LENGTH=96 /DNA_ID=CAMNT_0023340485 /DNA_START=214 /DNA_END=504 /DNA_ORIENTATION=+
MLLAAHTPHRSPTSTGTRWNTPRIPNRYDRYYPFTTAAAIGARLLEGSSSPSSKLEGASAPSSNPAASASIAAMCARLSASICSSIASSQEGSVTP